MTAVWITVLVLALAILSLAVSVATEVNKTRKSIEYLLTATDKVGSEADCCFREINRLYRDTHKQGKLFTLLIDHLGLELHTEPEKSTPSKTVIRPKIERGDDDA